MLRTAQHLTLFSRPQNQVSADNFRIQTVTLPALQPNKVLIKTIYLSIDPAIRIYIGYNKSYWKQMKIGEVVPTFGIGIVVESASKRYKAGDLVRGMMATGTLVVVHESGLFKVPAILRELPVILGVLGHPGVSAYVGLVNVGEIKQGETVLVSSAAGATGNAAVQIAKLLGCRVVGLVGSEEKRQWVSRQFHVDCINYNEAGALSEQLRTVCLGGVDIYYDNVGGSMLDAALEILKPHGRVVVCGAISGYDRPEEVPCYNMHLAITKSICIRGFHVRNYAKYHNKAFTALMNWMKKGQLVPRETVLKGLDQVPEALMMLFRGENIGKTLVQVSEDPFQPKL